MKFFPPYIGLDVSETSLKAVSLKQVEGGLLGLEAFGKDYLPPGAIVEGEIKDIASVLKTLKSILEKKENGFPKVKYVIASLPEEKTFSRVLEMPSALKEKEMAEALRWETESNLPLSLDEVYYDYSILNRNIAAGHHDVMVNAISKKIVDSYVNFFKSNGWQPLALELETVSVHRALFNKQSLAKEAVLVMDIGATKTRFMIVAEGIIRFTSSNSLAGSRFSQTLSEHFPVNMKEAEFMKRMVGLDKNQEKGQELLEALKPALLLLKEQIQNYIGFFESHPSKEKLHENAQKISKIILIGGGAGLWGLGDWLSQEISLPVLTGNPLSKIKNSHSAKIKMSLEDSLSYATAIGLALRSFEELS